MIVLSQNDRFRCVTQSDHAALAAEIFALWRLDGMPDHPRREALLRAIREHDNGWRETDAAPLVDIASGAPHDFRSLPGGARDALWERSTTRHAANDPYVALLITTHALRLHEDRRHETSWTAFLERMEMRWQELSLLAAIDEATVTADYRLLALADTVSLALCGASIPRFQRAGYTAQLAAETLHLKPFPLAGATTFRLNCRSIPQRRYPSDTDLAVALATARWETTPVRLAPAF